MTHRKEDEAVAARQFNEGRLGAFLGRGVSYDAKAPKDKRWVITEDYATCYFVIAEFPTKAKAQRGLRRYKLGLGFYPGKPRSVHD